ncbi:MAG: hypothetical protein EOP84_33595 [Verrucomicrobiaceae bacterium]|nr:MAG: hypothetical protein EOP84_33595 [Verrucomicrobiaceae bacterium]
MNSEEHDDLWHLLGKARQPTVSPFLSRDVIREVRNLQQERVGFFAWLRRHWKVPALGACAAVVIAAITFNSSPSERLAVDEHQQQLLALAETVSESPDYQVIAHLDELLDSEESSLWLDGNTY